jgi:hypothetical protein
MPRGRPERARFFARRGSGRSLRWSCATWARDSADHPFWKARSILGPLSRRACAAVEDALVAHEVAPELLGHCGHRRAVSVSMSAGFTVLASWCSIAIKEIAADLHAVETLRWRLRPNRA